MLFTELGSEITGLSTDSDCCAFSPKVFSGELPGNATPETIQIPKTEAPFMRERTRAETCRFELKCHKALWLQAREAVWSSCRLFKRIDIFSA